MSWLPPYRIDAAPSDARAERVAHLVDGAKVPAEVGKVNVSLDHVLEGHARASKYSFEVLVHQHPREFKSGANGWLTWMT